MTLVVIYSSIGLLVFLFLLFTNVVNPSIEEDSLNMVIVSWLCLFILCLVLWPIIVSMMGLILKALREKKEHKYISGFGLLNIVEVFDYYDEPVIFLAKGKKGDLFLGLLSDNQEDFKQHLYLPMSKHRLQLLKEGEIDIFTAFVESENGKVLSVLRDKTTKNEYNEWISCEDIDVTKIPDKGVKLCH